MFIWKWFLKKLFLNKLNGARILKRSTELFIGMRSLFRLYDKMLKKVCTAHDLTLIEADIISFLQNNPGKDTAADIVELRMLSKGAVSKGVESLIQKSLLERIPDNKDRRKIHLRLKSQAGPVTESINQVREQFVDTVLDGFSKEELELQTDFFRRLFDNVTYAMKEGSSYE